MNLPVGWKSIHIEDCCDILDSKRVPVSEEEREKRIGNIPYYGANGFQGYIDDFIFDEPLILIAEDGGRFDEFSMRSIAYRIQEKSWVNNHAHVLRAKKEYCQDAIFYSLEHKDIQPFIVGGTRSKLNQTALRSIPLDLPHSLSEQAKIAEILSTVDRAIQHTEALIDKQERIKIGLMQELFSRGIDEHGKLRSEFTHQFKDSAVGRIPVDWDLRTIGELAEFVTSGSRGWAKYYAVEGDRFLRIGDLTRDHINLRSSDLAFVAPPASSEGKRTAVEADDILISITADLGIIGVIPDGFGKAYVNQHVSLVRIAPDQANSRFVGWFLSSRGGQRQFDELNESGAKAGLNLPTIRELRVPIPSHAVRGPKEQDRIVAMLDQSVDKIESTIRTKEKLVHLKYGLMQDLLTGKKRVTQLFGTEKLR